ncbi:transcriptional repressor [Rhizobium leguminosarum]|uniref:Ferric uptake regulation protein n=1 Tax=Rhizobium leguminosarum TaxID=384 RepID=A0A1L3Z6P8_RHILE|nr:transcriptional repressor [Rhizobium leguminosarum]API51343.1 transcriptional repressor [Rhizobium leguminosarum]
MGGLSLVELENRCHRRGLRVTANLREILQALLAEPDHPDVDSLRERLRARGRRVCMATVYRNLGHLIAAGVVAEQHFGPGKARYEVATPHDHLIDISTGKIIEFSEPRLNALEDEIAAQMGYRILRRRLEFYAVPVGEKT